MYPFAAQFRKAFSGLLKSEQMTTPDEDYTAATTDSPVPEVAEAAEPEPKPVRLTIAWVDTKEVMFTLVIPTADASLQGVDFRMLLGPIDVENVITCLIAAQVRKVVASNKGVSTLDQ
jgi:hypothetical protein